MITLGNGSKRVNNTWYEDVEWINLHHDRVQWLAAANTVIHLWVP
jgi:hypothetical protein